MMNVGENRAQNGVLDCPKLKNEENFLSIGRKGSSRYAEVGLRVLRGVRDESKYLKNPEKLRESLLYYHFGDILLHLYYQVDRDSGENAPHKLVIK
ncbi:hypothetical protein E3N88_38649 [Mikania micrantha]|uniref:Uncharacterized protein n=1 Tax=Mikania micrantha TaxID=192012 RepID=A0A5N6LX47_9ASTR|nr:hypothetical protein E3N88_38649 [Mikania micrantha]